MMASPGSFSETVPLPIRVLPHAQGLEPPRYQRAGAAGLDLMAANAEDAPVVIAPGGRALVPTGLMLSIPAGCEGQVRPRSGLAARNGVTILNAPGTIDSDYRGEVQVLLVNFGEEPFVVTRGMRIAQLVIAPVVRVEPVPVAVLEDTLRGGGGFGSTGL